MKVALEWIYQKKIILCIISKLQSVIVNIYNLLWKITKMCSLKNPKSETSLSIKLLRSIFKLAVEFVVLCRCSNCYVDLVFISFNHILIEIRNNQSIHFISLKNNLIATIIYKIFTILKEIFSAIRNVHQNHLNIPS
jgi:hypothetical protein